MKMIKYLTFLLALLAPFLVRAATLTPISPVGVTQGELLPTAFTKINNNFFGVTNKLYLMELVQEASAALYGNTFSGSGANLRSNAPIFQSGMNLGNFVTAGLVVSGSASAMDVTATKFIGGYHSAGHNNTDLRPPWYHAQNDGGIGATNDMFRGAYTPGFPVSALTVFRVDYLGNVYLNNTATPSPTTGQVLTRLANGSAGWSDPTGGGGDVSESDLNAAFQASTNYSDAAFQASTNYSDAAFRASTNYAKAATNDLAASLTTLMVGYDAVATNWLWTNMLARLTATNEAILLANTQLVVAATGTLAAASWQIASNFALASFLSSSNMTRSATNTEHAYWDTRVGNLEADSLYYLRMDGGNEVDWQNFYIQSNGGQTWHVNVDNGYDGTTNPNLWSRIGAPETLTSKTLLGPVITGGTSTDQAITTPSIDDPTMSGTITSDGANLVGSISGGSYLQPSLRNPGINVTEVSDVSNIILTFIPTGGDLGAAPTMRVLQEAAGSTGGRAANFGLYSINDNAYSVDDETYARIAEVKGASNGVLAEVQKAHDTNATQTAAIGALQTPLSGARGTGYFTLNIPMAKLPNTNFAVIAGGWQNWELTYLRTNGSGALTTNSAFWSLPVPPDYVSNTMTLRLLSILNATNGPNSSNSIFRVSTLAIVPGTTTDIHVGAFGPPVSGTNTWTALSTGTNQVQSMLLSLTNCSAKAGDMLLLKVDRDCATDTVNGPVSIVGATLEYTR